MNNAKKKNAGANIFTEKVRKMRRLSNKYKVFTSAVNCGTFFLYLLISSFSFQSLAANYYVNDGVIGEGSAICSAIGNNVNAGTAALPKATLANVFSTYNLAAGDIIYVDVGSYSESMTAVGSDDEGFIIQGVSEALTIFNGANVTTYFITIDNAGNDNISFQNLTIKNYGTTAANGNAKAIFIGGGTSDKAITGIVISNVTFDDIDCNNANASYGGAIGHTSYAGGSDLTVNDCTFLNNDSGSGACYTNAAGTGDVINITFNNCVFHTNSSAYRCAVYRAPNPSSSVTVNWNYCVYYNNTSARTLIFSNDQPHNFTNCLFYKNTVTDATKKGVYEALGTSATNFRNTTIVGNNGGGIYVAVTTVTTNIYSCIIQDNTNGNDIIEFADGTTNVYHTIYNTLTGDFETNTNNETTDATFTNSAGDDYTLAAASNGLSEAYTTGAPADDLVGKARDATPDMGCYERVSGYYWVGGTGNWSSFATHWATSTGGASFNSVAPTATDNVVFDANSGGGTVTIDGASICANFTGTGYTGTIAGSSGLTISGNLVIGSGMSWSHTGSTTFYATATGKTITSNGVSLATPITFNGTGGAWTLADALTTTGAVTLTAGTLSLSSYTMSTGGNFSIASASTFTPSTGTVTFTGSDAAINGTTAAPSFYNIVVNKTAGQTLSTSGSVTSLTVTNNFTETTGHFTAPATMTITGVATLSAGTFTAPSGTLTITSGFVNNTTFTHNSGTVTFNGGSAQTISGTTDPNFYNFTLSNASGSSISLNTTVQSTFTFTSGLFTTQGYTLTIGTNGTNGSVAGYSSARYFVAYDNSGTIGTIKQFINLKASTAYVYPIGDLTNYTPFTFTVNAASTLAAGAHFTMYTKAAKISGLYSGITTYLTRYWRGTDSGITTPNYDISYDYSASDVIVGTEANLMPVKKSGTTWYKPSGSLFTTGTAVGTGGFTIGTRTLTWAGLTSFSDFGGAGSQGIFVSLPISLISFAVQKVGNDNELLWETATEKGNDYFIIEKTVDGEIFEIVGTQNGAGTNTQLSNYSMIDYNVQKAINYYRLKQTDFDGKYTFSDLISFDNRQLIDIEKTIVKAYDILGREIDENYSGLVYLLYSDGSTSKIIQ